MKILERMSKGLSQKDLSKIWRVSKKTLTKRLVFLCLMEKPHLTLQIMMPIERRMGQQKQRSPRDYLRRAWNVILVMISRRKNLQLKCLNWMEKWWNVRLRVQKMSLVFKKMEGKDVIPIENQKLCQQQVLRKLRKRKWRYYPRNLYLK